MSGASMTNKIQNLTNQGRGRPKGSENRVTTEFRETVKKLLENNAGNVERWLTTVAEGDGDQVKPDPKSALDLMAKLAEYATPKLARTELAGNEEQPVQIKISWEDD